MRVLRHLATLALAAAVAAIAPAVSAAELTRLVVFTEPIPHYDAVWMADAKGLFKAAGLDVQFRLFASGTTALQSFKAGQGDIEFGGDFPGVQYWVENNKDYRMIAAIQKDAKSYVLTTNTDITKSADLKGKILATRLGSNVDWFMSAYLKRNGISQSDVTIKNLDGQVMPAALCQGDINAFFFWQPYNDKAVETCPTKAHNLSNAEGYIPGYVVAGARPGWLAKPENARATEAFLKAIAMGKQLAEKDLDAVVAYGAEKYSMPAAPIKEEWKNSIRLVTLDDTVYKDYCGLADWMREKGYLKGPLDLSEFVWTDGIKSFDPAAVTKPPPPC